MQYCRANQAQGVSILDHRSRKRWEQVLTAGELGASAAQTTIVAVLPLLLRPYARSNFWIGFAVGGEGVFALLLPYWIGVLSDRMPSAMAIRFGRRMLLLLVTTPIMAVSIAAAPFLHTYWLMAAAAFVFFAALHGYLTPLWALMLDSVPDERRARVQGTRGILRALGLAYGLVGAGLLYSIRPSVPFLAAAALVVLTTWLTWLAELKIGGDRTPVEHDAVGTFGTWRQLAGNASAVWLLAANALWNGAIDGIRPYVFLYAAIVLGLTVVNTSLALGALIVGIGVGSIIAGRLGDRLPRGRLLQIGTGVLVVSMSIGAVLRNAWWAGLALGAGGLGAAAILTIGYPYFAQLVGEVQQGGYTGLWVFSVGFGRIVAPMLVGVAIDLGNRVMPRVRGYPMMWAAAGLMGIAGWLALWQAMRSEARRALDRAAEGRAA